VAAAADAAAMTVPLRSAAKASLRASPLSLGTSWARLCRILRRCTRPPSRMPPNKVPQKRSAAEPSEGERRSLGIASC
jgi:hypothetical protein